jgi:hypothetical protein
VKEFVPDQLDLLGFAAPEGDGVAPGEDEGEALARYQVRFTEQEHVHVRQLGHSHQLHILRNTRRRYLYT